jgi:hypothetical protein
LHHFARYCGPETIPFISHYQPELPIMKETKHRNSFSLGLGQVEAAQELAAKAFIFDDFHHDHDHDDDDDPDDDVNRYKSI